MNISASISALQSINASFNTIPSRIYDSFHGTEPKEGLGTVLTDMKMEQHAFSANVKVLQTMNNVENILLEDLRKQD